MIGMGSLSEAELDFRDLISNPERREEYLAWSEGVRLRWERANVVWLHGYKDGKAVWKRERPPPEKEDEPARTQQVKGRRYAYTRPA